MPSRRTDLGLSFALLGCGARTGLGSSSTLDAAIVDSSADVVVIDAGAADAPALCPASVEVTNDPFLDPPVALAVGSAHTCAMAGAGVWCWGTDLQFELGAKTKSQARPVRVKVQPVAQIASGSAFDICTGTRGSHTCAVLADGRVWCWGANVEGETDSKVAKPTPMPIDLFGLTGVAQVAVSGYHSCVVLNDRSARCWGSDAFGQLGDGQIIAAAKPPVPVSGIAGPIVEIATGHESTCAVLQDGTIMCWGNGAFGALGDGTTTTHASPAPVIGIPPATNIAMFWFHACAIAKDRSLVCWGWNDSGQLGDGTKQDRPVPAKVPGVLDVVQIAVGVKHTCAVSGDGTLRCWGSNSFGQLGFGAFGQQQVSPIVVPLANVVEVRTGLFHTCARTKDASIWCWGWNDFGQLGDGTTTSRTTPVRIN